jgi:pyruvate/2-oxoglutarate dehydrogenase complex dihydrolipoamide acyltransferase (E2) component
MTPNLPLVLERDNVNDESVVLVRWFVKHGSKIAPNELLAEVETSKANVEVYAPQAGFLLWGFPEGADVAVGAPIGFISEIDPGEAAEFVAPPNPEAKAQAQQAAKTEPSAAEINPAQTHKNDAKPTAAGVEFPISSPYRQRFSPVAAKMMKDHGLTEKDFAGKSVVRKQDVLDLLEPPPAVAATAARPTVPLSKITIPYKQTALSKMKRREGSSLAAGVGNAIQSAVSVTCVTQGLRRKLAARMAGGSASALMVYEVSRLLRKYPTFNATYRDGSILQFEQVNLGFAMDDGRGLKVAVLPDCDALSLQQVSTQLSNLTVAYIQDKLTPADVSNATFTISDLSGMGVSSFYPLISENQGAILGVGAEEFLPGSAWGSFVLTLAFDHQLSDGRTAALFLNDLKSRLQSYEGPPLEAHQEVSCYRCGRTADQVAELNSMFLQSASPEGVVCSLCAAGFRT